MNYTKKLAIIPIVLTSLTILGAAINLVIPWSYLTIFFGIIRRFVMVFDFAWDTTTLWLLVGLYLQVEVVYWLFKATVLFVSFFVRNK